MNIEKELFIQHLRYLDEVREYEDEDGYMVASRLIDRDDPDDEESISFYAFCSTETIAEALKNALDPPPPDVDTFDFLRRLSSLVNDSDAFGYGLADEPDADVRWDGKSGTATLNFSTGASLKITVTRNATASRENTVAAEDAPGCDEGEEETS